MVKYSVLLVFLFLVSVGYSAEKSYGNVECTVVAVYDGDTFTVDVAGWPAIVGERIGVRINGIDTPERKSTDPRLKALATKARETTVELLRKAKKVELRNIHRDKYFRIDADVFVDGQNLAEVLLSKGLAKKYDGGKKPDWSVP